MISDYLLLGFAISRQNIVRWKKMKRHLSNLCTSGVNNWGLLTILSKKILHTLGPMPFRVKLAGQYLRTKIEQNLLLKRQSECEASFEFNCGCSYRI